MTGIRSFLGPLATRPRPHDHPLRRRPAPQPPVETAPQARRAVMPACSFCSSRETCWTDTPSSSANRLSAPLRDTGSDEPSTYALEVMEDREVAPARPIVGPDLLTELVPKRKHWLKGPRHLANHRKRCGSRSLLSGSTLVAERQSTSASKSSRGSSKSPLLQIYPPTRANRHFFFEEETWAVRRAIG